MIPASIDEDYFWTVVVAGGCLCGLLLLFLLGRYNFLDGD